MDGDEAHAIVVVAVIDHFANGFDGARSEEEDALIAGSAGEVADLICVASAAFFDFDEHAEELKI